MKLTTDLHLIPRFRIRGARYPHSVNLEGFGLRYRDNFVGFEVLATVSTKMAVFWVVAPCSLVEVYQRLRGPCRDDGGSKNL
jgi:hypothetical protein